MGYQNNNRQNQQQGNNYRQNNNNNNGGNRPKRSGATFFLIEKGKSKGMMGFNAWMSGKGGLKKFSGFGYAKTKGDKCEFQKAVCEVVDMSTGQVSTYPVLINVTTKRVAIDKLNLLITSAGGGVTSTGKRVRGAVVRLNG